MMMLKEIENGEKSRNRQEEPNTKRNKIISEDSEPEDGWECLPVFGIIFILFTTIRPTSIIFGDFLEASGQAGIALSFSFSFYTIGSSLAGLVIKISTEIYSFRFVEFVGTVLFLISSITMTFARNIYIWAYAYFLQGLAIGIMYTVTITVFSTCFVKYRKEIFYACHAVIGLIKMWFPSATIVWMELYGLRDTAFTMDIIMSLIAIVGMAMMLSAKRICAKKTSKKTQSQKVAVSNLCSTTDVISVSTKTKSVPTFKNKINEEIREKKQNQSNEKDQKE